MTFHLKSSIPDSQRQQHCNSYSKCPLHNNFWKRIYPGTTQNLLTQCHHVNTIRDVPLPLDAISLAININRKLATINPKLKGTLFSRTGNYKNTSHDLSTPLPLGAISLAININQMLVTINPKSTGTILNYIKTGKDYSLAVNSTEFLY